MNDISLASSSIDKIYLKPLINGEYTRSCCVGTLILVNRLTGDKSIDATVGYKEDIGCAGSAPRTAFSDGRWSGLSPSQRRTISIKSTKLLNSKARTIEVLDNLDMSKCLNLPVGAARPSVPGEDGLGIALNVGLDGLSSFGIRSSLGGSATAQIIRVRWFCHG